MNNLMERYIFIQHMCKIQTLHILPEIKIFGDFLRRRVKNSDFCTFGASAEEV